jgi:uncharacterized protein YndB with AHSA1/START domain
MVDVQAHIDAVDRAVSVDEIDGVASRVQTLHRVFRAGLADVWDAVTSAERIPRWFMPVTGELRVGGRYQLVGNAGGVVEACSPPAGDTAEFRVTWEYGGGAPSWLTIRLTEEAPDATRLELVFTGRVDDLPAEMWQQFGPSATGIGWEQGLLGLALYLSSDHEVKPEDGPEWSMSDEGMRFMRLAADGWAAADVAAGADPQDAAAAADRTYATYTGAAPGPME